MPKYDSPPFTSVHAVGGESSKNKEDGLSPTIRAGKNGQDRPVSPPTMYNPFFTGRPRTPGNSEGRTSPIDRQEIIRKIKQGDLRPSSPQIEAPNRVTKSKSRSVSRSPSRSPSSQRSRSPARLLSSSGHETSTIGPGESSDQNALGLGISRPKSALHRGDFRVEEHSSAWRLDGQDQQYTPTRHWQDPPATSPVAPWHHAFPKNAHRQTLAEQSPSTTSSSVIIPTRPRAASQATLSTSFTYQPPTSPLVHQANAADIPDHDTHNRHPRLRSPDRRRHTFSPRLVHQSKSALDNPSFSTPVVQSHAVPLRRETTFPYQAHQPRRSVGSLSGLPQSPYPGARRPSVSDASPLQHAPMVGSYEESILRGRMSTPASKPLDFVAQIGVLGKGDCKSSLKCPPHVSVPFPAVFYSYPSGLAVDPEPSPYVGMVDLENTLRNAPPRDHSRKRRRHRSPHDQRHGSPSRHEDEGVDSRSRIRKHQKARRRSQSPKEPAGGSYRIPKQGQLQIVLKNPNKTAVKLFLVPYDLSNMEPGQKTFIRQRSYSAGPIIDMPISTRKNYGTDRPEASLSTTTDPKDRPILRYLIHLNICCPSKNRYYLYQNIRVVFANRVPDGKEKLRSEIQTPEPRYSTYKPAAVPASSVSGMSRRRSSVADGSMSAVYSGAPGALSASIGSDLFGNHQLFVKSVDDISFKFPATQRLPTLESRPSSRGLSDDNNVDDTPQSPTSPSIARTLDRNVRDELTFSREASRERVAGGRKGESLLSRRLRDLEMRGSDNGGG